ncbi:TetR/AcrR family transcriptional regulator [Embleya sp. NPDC050493]|uniref:TetR/AcrR family transcriptional regulator n=1 Tax=Embleya sp. NPDC050493 TaxID=3363989 RepID=UPI0037880F7D
MLWGGERERPSRGPKPGLSTARIVEVAIEVADREGLSAVSMQRIASEFGFTTMSLYRYLPGKAQLIDFMIDAAIDVSPSLDDVADDWRPKLEEWARRLRGVYHRHPWMFELAAPGPMGPNQLSWLEAAVDSLSGTGLTGAEKLDAVFALTGLIRSWIYRSVSKEEEQQPITSDMAEQWGSDVGELVRTHRDRYPALLAAMSSGAFEPAEGDGEEFGLRCVLDGIGVLIKERAAAAARANA